MNDYNQLEIDNINIVLKIINLKLKQYNKYDVYSTNQLIEFAEQSLTRFNSIPPFTNFTWEDSSFLDYNDLADLAICLLIESGLKIKKGNN